MANKQKYSVTQVEQAIRSSAGLLCLAAEKLRCSPSTVTNYIERYKSLQRAVEESLESTLDMAEAELLKKIKDGELTAIIFFLKTKGKKRGYSERQEVTGINGEAISYVIEAPALLQNTEEWTKTYKPTLT